MCNKLGIVIIGYKNTEGIKRLLSSLDNVEFYNDKVTLIISIDYSGDAFVEELARNYDWKHGEKIIKAYKANLGLRTHILKCGDYLDEFDMDALAVLEDDIYVAPAMYSFMRESVAFYKDDDRIAGISLYKHEFNLYAKHPFQDMKDGGDTFFIQYAQSWGQVWLRDQWHEFKKWFCAGKWETIDKDLVPNNVLNWKNSWLKYHIMYCIDTNKYFVYPRVSLTTNFSDAGTHSVSNTTAMQVAFDISTQTSWRFNTLESTNAVYDCFFENQRVGELINDSSIEIDLYGSKKKLYEKKKLLTSRALPYRVEKSYGLLLRPQEANIICDVSGDDIYLYDLSVRECTAHKGASSVEKFEYDNKGVNVLQSAVFLYVLKQLKTAFMHKFKKIKRKIRK